MITMISRYCLIIVVVMLVSASLYGQIHIIGSLADNRNKSVNANVLVCLSDSHGFAFPEYGAIDTLNAPEGQFRYVLGRPGIYFLCIRSGQLPSINIPLPVEVLSKDTMRLTIIIDSIPTVQALPPYQYVGELHSIHRRFHQMFIEGLKNDDIAHQEQKDPAKLNDSALRKYLYNIVINRSNHILIRRLAGNYLTIAIPTGRHSWKQLHTYKNAVIALLPETSYFWSMDGANGGYALKQLDTTEKHPDFALLRRIAHKNPVLSVRAYTNMDLLFFAQQHGKKRLLAEACSDYRKNYLHNPNLNNETRGFLNDIFARQCSDKKSIVVGKNVPEFSFNVHHSDVPVSSRSLHGKVYLLDFWTTGCGSCIREIPIIEELYHRYKAQGFTVISLNNEPAEIINAFRKNRYKMPWIHAKLTPQEWTQLQKAFETYSTFPNPILVGENGAILAAREGAMGNDLKKKLAEVFGGK